jgi:hypothetical protein
MPKKKIGQKGSKAQLTHVRKKKSLQLTLSNTLSLV